MRWGDQVVYGVDTEDQGCIYAGDPMEHPGVSVTGKAFNVTVPMTAGVHEVRVAQEEEFTCPQAIALRPLANHMSSVARIGVIIVR